MVNNEHRTAFTIDRDIDDNAFSRYFAERPQYPGQEARLHAANEAIDLVIQLHRLRNERGLTQATLAEQAGLQQQAVSRLERGFSPSMQLGTLRRYLEALGCDMDILVTDKATRRLLGRICLPGS